MTPQLRFPEFTDEWQVKKLSDLLTVVIDNRGKTPPITTEGIPLIETNALGDKQVKYGVIKKFVTKDTFDSWFRKHLEDKDVLFSTVGQTGVTALYDKEVIAGIAQNIVGLRANEQMTGDFLYYLLTEKRNNNRFKQIEMIAVQPSVKVSQMIHLRFKLPLKPEQEKIAEFLTAVDERIAAGEKKLELLQKYKNGVMQKIFTQSVRFKDENGNPYPEWEEKQLGELCKTAKSGGTPTATNRAYYENGTIPFLAISDITEQGKYLIKTSKFINELGLKKSASWLVPKGSIIYSMYASVGFVAINEIPMATSQAVINLTPNKLTTSEFLYYFLSDYRSKIHRFIETGTQGNLNAQTVKNIVVGLPNLEEQQKIATFLTALDNKIAAERTRLTAAKQWKKGLLQRMFV